jgi:hypothetical protein
VFQTVEPPRFLAFPRVRSTHTYATSKTKTTYTVTVTITSKYGATKTLTEKVKN